MLLPEAIGTTLTGSVIGERAIKVAKALTQPEQSLLDFARIGQISPFVVIDADIRHNPLMRDLLHVLCTLYTATYMQALAYEDLLGDVTIAERIDKFRPGGPSLVRTPNEVFGLPKVAAFEAYNDRVKAKAVDTTAKAPRPSEEPSPSVEPFTKDNMSELNEDRSLAVGKRIILKLHDRLGNPRPIPITVRMVPATINSTSLVEVFSMGSRWNSSSERYHRVKMGELHWLWDGLFKMDMIDAHRRALMTDESGVYAALSKRRSTTFIDSIVNGRQSLATASAITIMSARTAKELERRLGGKLSSQTIRNSVFNETGMMIIVVYDPTFEHITFYYRGSPDAASFTANEIKSSSKKKDVDMLEIINTLMNKGAPTF